MLKPVVVCLTGPTAAGKSAATLALAQRFDALLQAGFLEEVLRLHARAGLHAGLPSMRCVGYRQL